MTDQELTQFAKTLQDAGIQMHAVYEPIGCSFCLRPSDVAPFVRDRDGFFAGECALEKSTYVEWKEFMAGERKCSAATAHGGCGNVVKDSAALSPQEYARRKDEGTLLCAYHMSATRK